jgi:hypothetical protein
MLAGTAQAQQAVTVADDATAPATAYDGVKTLDEVRATKPDDEPLDLYRFKNPVQVENNRFSRSWSEPRTPEQVSQSGGYILLGINYGLMAAAKGLHKLTNGRDQIQSAVARPPPELSEAQLRRAASQCLPEECVLPSAGK